MKHFVLLILLTICHSQLLFAQELMTSESQKTSITKKLNSILEGDNAFKSYNLMVDKEQSVCINGKEQFLETYTDKNLFYQMWELNCTALNSSELCSKVSKEDKLICDEPPKTPWYRKLGEKGKSCWQGFKKSWQEWFHFVGQIGKFIINKETEVKDANGGLQTVKYRDHVTSQISTAFSSMKSNMASEMTKYQHDHKVGPWKAFWAVVDNLMSKFVRGLDKMLEKAAPMVGCYNYKAKTRVICQVMAEFIADPIIMFKLVKLGPKVLKGTRFAKFFKSHNYLKTAKKSKTALKRMPSKNIEDFPLLSIKSKKLRMTIEKDPALFNQLIAKSDTKKYFNQLVQSGTPEDLASFDKILIKLQSMKMNSHADLDLWMDKTRQALKQECIR